MDAKDSQDCFHLALTGTPFKEIASVKELDEVDVRRAVEAEVAARVDVDEFPDFNEALDFLRLGRLQRGLWTTATSGNLAGTRQVLELMDQRSSFRKSRQDKPLNEAVRDMMAANNIQPGNYEEQDDE